MEFSYKWLTLVLVVFCEFGNCDKYEKKNYEKGPKRYQVPDFNTKSTSRAPNFIEKRKWKLKTSPPPETCGVTAKVAGVAGDALQTLNKAVPGLMPKSAAADVIKILNDFKYGKTEKATKAVVAKTTSYLLGSFGATAGALLGSIIYSKIGTFVGGLVGGVVGTELAEQIIHFFYRLFY